MPQYVIYRIYDINSVPSRKLNEMEYELELQDPIDVILWCYEYWDLDILEPLTKEELKTFIELRKLT